MDGIPPRQVFGEHSGLTSLNLARASGPEPGFFRTSNSLPLEWHTRLRNCDLDHRVHSLMI